MKPGSDVTLHSRVVAPRRANDTPASTSNRASSPAPATPAPASGEQPGPGAVNFGPPTKLGRFTVLEMLGQGGMGVVYACYDSQLDRKVAVKLLHRQKPQNLDVAHARLLREAQAMARLSHPNIVMVLDVGSVDEQMFVAMEFVRGQGLDAWVQKESRTWKEILAAFLQAGRGLEAAHRAGIIHRDFKPQNVLVTAEGVVKVLDFGLARATETSMQDLLASIPDSVGDAQSLLMRPLTQTGAFLGTPAYMSPEQHRGEKVTPATDQFSFCVSLYQSLYGHFPFSTVSLSALRQDILRGAVTPPPMRSTVPMRVFKVLRRGMAVAIDERFPSMTEMLAELARDPEAARRRVAVTAAVAATVGFASFAAAGAYTPGEVSMCPDSQPELLGIWDAERVAAVKATILATESPYAGEAWATIEPQMQRYADSWAEMRNEACHTHEEGRQSDHLFDLRTACLDQRRAGFAGLVDVLASIDAATLNQAVSAVGRLPALESCADSRSLTAAIAPPEDPQIRAQVQGWRETLARAGAQELAGRYQAGLALVENAKAAALKLDYPPLLAEVLLRQGSLQMETNALVAADAALDQALLSAVASDHEAVAAQAISKLAFLRAARMDQPAQAQALVPMARALNKQVEDDFDLYAEFLNNLGVVYLCTGAYRDAEQALREALTLRERHGQSHSARALIILDNLGSLAMHENRDLDRVALYRQVVALSGPVLGEHHPEHLRFVRNLAHGLRDTGRLGEAGDLLRRVERDLDATPTGLVHAWIHADLGAIELEERDLDSAKKHFEAVLRDASDQAYLVQNAQKGLGRMAALAGDEAGVRRYFGAVLSDSERRLGAQSVGYLARQYNFATALLDLGRPQEAIAQLELVREGMAQISSAQSLGALPPETRYSLGKAYQKLGDLAAARREFTLALEGFEQILPFQNLNIVPVQQALGEVALAEGRLDVALDWLRRAESGYMAIVEPGYVPLALTRLALAQALTGASPTAPPEALTLADRALTPLRAHGPAFAPETQAVLDFLREHHAPGL